jgi:hypothetical protein
MRHFGNSVGRSWDESHEFLNRDRRWQCLTRNIVCGRKPQGKTQQREDDRSAMRSRAVLTRRFHGPTQAGKVIRSAADARGIAQLGLMRARSRPRREF